MKIYLNKINENWVVDRFYKEWHKYNSEISTKSLRKSDIIWVIAPWMKNLNDKIFEEKKSICTIHHIDFKKFNTENEKEFYSLDKNISAYHTVSQKTKLDLVKLTDKKIYSIPFWVNQNIFFKLDDKNKVRKKLSLDTNRYLVGSFQRDTEGHDELSPKLSKGPDQLIEIYDQINKTKPNFSVVLTGYRRGYIIKELKKRNIHFYYFPKVNFSKLNMLYNSLDFYIVASRVEGGPVSIMETALTGTPLISTNVGLATEILHKDAIYQFPNFGAAVPNTENSYNNVKNYIIPNGFQNFRSMFKEIGENRIED
jgi:glycosyltransferase involved in cell wall biosynthesis